MDNVAKKQNRIKGFFKGLAVATAITVGYGFFYSQCDNYLIKALSQKKEFVAGIDFEAYKQKESLNILTQNKEVKETKEIQNWSYIPMSDILEWQNRSYSNALGFTPYYGDLETAYSYTSSDEEKKEKKEKSALEVISEGDNNIKNLVSKIKNHDIVVLRVRGDSKAYEILQKDDPITFVTNRIAQNVIDFEKKVVIELEAPDNGDYKAHNERIKLVKKTNPNFKVATTLDMNEGYNPESKTWDPEKSKKYWENADIIILEDYSSRPSDLEKSLQNFKKATQGKKQVWVRVVVGSKRINERGVNDLENAIKEYEQTIQVIKEHSDGCLVNDTNGTWLFSKDAPDGKERLKKTKQLYKMFRKIKIERTYSYGGMD